MSAESTLFWVLKVLGSLRLTPLSWAFPSYLSPELKSSANSTYSQQLRKGLKQPTAPAQGPQWQLGSHCSPEQSHRDSLRVSCTSLHKMRNHRFMGIIWVSEFTLNLNHQSICLQFVKNAGTLQDGMRLSHVWRSYWLHTELCPLLWPGDVWHERSGQRHQVAQCLCDSRCSPAVSAKAQLGIHPYLGYNS